MELREDVTAEDAYEVVEIMKCSMIDTACDELGTMDFARSQHGSGMSKRGMSKAFVSELSAIADSTYNSLFTLQQLRKIANQLNLSYGNFTDFISSLNNQGFLLQKGAKTYQLLSSAM